MSAENTEPTTETQMAEAAGGIPPVAPEDMHEKTESGEAPPAEQAENTENAEATPEGDAENSENNSSEDESDENKEDKKEDEDTSDEKELTPKLAGYHVLNNAHIFVMNGVHEGATFKINEAITIGSSFENELILTDETVEEAHLHIEPHETNLGFGIKVTCKGANIIVNGERILTTGQDLVLMDTFVVTLGDISLNITINSADMVTTAYKKFVEPRINIANDYKEEIGKKLTIANIMSDIRNIILIAFVVVILIMVASLIYLTRDTSKAPLNPERMSYKELALQKQDELRNHTKKAYDDLLRTIRQYDLSGRISVDKTPTTLYVRGRINNYENGKWMAVQNWYDSTYGPYVNLVSLLEVHNGLRRTISFKAVVTQGRMPYVVSWTGDRYRPGATLPGGWIIEKIDEIGVHVRDAVENRLFVVEHIRSRRGYQGPNVGMP